MRKIFYAVAAATLLFTSCAEVEIQVRPIVESTEDFTATVGADSRAHLDGTKVLWDETDKITIFTKTAHNRQYQIKSLEDDQRTATFSYAGYTGTDNTAISANYAIYPYDADATLSGDVITTTINAEQSYDAEKVDLQNAIMVAKSSTNEFSFVNAGALLRFKLCTENIPDTFSLNSIELVSKNHTLAGTATIDLAGDSKAVITEGVNEVSLTGIDATIDATEQMFYIALPATDFEAEDLTVTFNFAEGAKTLTLPAFALNQGSIKTISYPIKDTEDFTGTTDSYTKTEVATAEELKSAIAAGRDVVLAADITLDEILVVGGNSTIDGDGKTLTSTMAGANGRAINVSGAESVTIKNMTIVAAGERAINIIQNSKNVTIENVTATAANYTVNVAGSAPGTVVTINNSNLTGLNTVNVGAADVNITINKTEITCNDQNANESYAAIAFNENATNATVTVNECNIIVNGDSYAANQVADGSQVIFDDKTTGNKNIKGSSYVIKYGNYSYSFISFAEAFEKVKDGETIVLTKDITVEEPLVVAGKNITFDLNGHNITNDKSDVFVVTSGTLTINGEGVVYGSSDNSSSSCAVWAKENGNVVINGGTYKVGDDATGKTENGGSGNWRNDCIYARDNATITIYGGKFQYTGENPEGHTFVLNLRGGSNASIVVYGGEFYKFNPANNVSEGAGTNFVAEGKTSTADGDWYIVK